MMDRPKHVNPAVEDAFQSAERDWSWTFAQTANKAQFIVYCKPGYECGRVTALPTAGLAAQQWQNVRREHFKGHK